MNSLTSKIAAVQAFGSAVGDHLMNALGASWWLWSGLAHGLVFFLIARLMVYGYREHAYLYQFDNRNRFADSWIQVLVPYVRRMNLAKYRAHLAQTMSQAGTRLDWDSNHFIASQILVAAVAAVGSYVLLWLMLGLPFVFSIVITLIAAALPWIRLTDIAGGRVRSVSRELPFYIDYLSLAMGAGLDFNQGMSAVLADVPKSPLRDEFSRVLRDIKLGRSREDGLLEMSRRLDIGGVKLFVQTLVQAMRMGSDVVNTLTVLSDSLQTKRFQDAEERAGKISVKMMIPMMLFVMPATMIILLGPMILEYLQSAG